jgi:hypothetical protein
MGRAALSCHEADPVRSMSVLAPLLLNCVSDDAESANDHTHRGHHKYTTRLLAMMLGSVTHAYMYSMKDGSLGTH